MARHKRKLCALLSMMAICFLLAGGNTDSRTCDVSSTVPEDYEYPPGWHCADASPFILTAPGKVDSADSYQFSYSGGSGQITWSSSSEGVSFVDNGNGVVTVTFQASACGTPTITATDGCGHEARVSVPVKYNGGWVQGPLSNGIVYNEGGSIQYMGQFCAISCETEQFRCWCGGWTEDDREATYEDASGGCCSAPSCSTPYGVTDHLSTVNCLEWVCP